MPSLIVTVDPAPVLEPVLDPVTTVPVVGPVVTPVVPTQSTPLSQDVVDYYLRKFGPVDGPRYTT